MVLEIKISKHTLSKVFLSFIFLFIIALSALAIPFFFFYNDSTSVNAAPVKSVAAPGTCVVDGTVFQKGANTGLCALAPEQSWAADYKNAWCGQSSGDANCGCPSRSNSDFTSHGQDYNFCSGQQITPIPTTVITSTAAKLPEGSVCTNPTQCSSNSCMNGYCVLDCSQASNKARCSCGATLCVDASANNGAGNPADRYACSIERPGVCLKNGAACAPSPNDGKSVDCDPSGGRRLTCSGSQNVSANIVSGGTCSSTNSTCSGLQALSCGGMTGYTLGNYGTYANKVVNVSITTNTGETVPAGEIVVKLSTRNNNAIVGGKLASNAPGENVGANAVGNASCMDPATIVNSGSERTGSSNSGNSAQLTGVQCFNAPFDIYIDSANWELVSQDASEVKCVASPSQGTNNATLVVRRKAVITTTTPVVTTAPASSAQCVSLNITSSNGMQRCFKATGQFNNINADHIDIVPYDGGPASSFSFPAQSGTFTSSPELCFTYPANGQTYTAKAYAYVQDSSKQNIVTGNGVGACTQVIVGQQITTTPPTTTIITTTPPITTIITTTPPITTMITTTVVTSTPPTTTVITTTPPITTPITTTVTPHSTVLGATTAILPKLPNTGQGSVLLNILAGFGLLALITIVLMSRNKNSNQMSRFTNASNVEEDNWFSYLTNLPNKMKHTQAHKIGKETALENFYIKALYSMTPISSPEYYRELEKHDILKMLHKSFGKNKGI